jgi:hypothetical protein
MSTPRYDWSVFDEHVLERARSLSCVDLIREYGLAPRGARSRFNICCPHPAHDDSDPSCSIRPGSWKCFGCGERGDVLDLIGVLDGLERFEDKIRRALELQGLDYEAEREAFLEEARGQVDGDKGAPGYQVRPGQSTHDGLAPASSPRPAGARRRDGDAAILEFVLGALELSGEAADYLEGRGLSGALARAHGLVSVSYARWSEVVASAVERFGEAALEHAGLLGSSGRAHPYVEQMLVIPYLGPSGPVGIRIRRLSKDTTYRGARYLGRRHGHNAVELPYLGQDDGAPAGLVPHRGLLWVVEGELDALSLRALGRASLGVPGAQAFRGQWVRGWGGLTGVVLVLDSDRAGVHAADDLAATITAECVRVHGQSWVDAHLHMRSTAGAKDPNELHARGELIDFVRAIERELMTQDVRRRRSS